MPELSMEEFLGDSGVKSPNNAPAPKASEAGFVDIQPNGRRARVPKLFEGKAITDDEAYWLYKNGKLADDKGEVIKDDGPIRQPAGPVAPPRKAAPAAKPASRNLSMEEFTGAPGAKPAVDPFSKEGLDAQLRSDMVESFKEKAKRFGLNAAAAVDLVAGLPGQALAVGADLGGRLAAFGQGGSRSDMEWAGKATASMVPKSLTNPIEQLMHVAGFDKGYSESDVMKVMGAFAEGIGMVGEKVEKITEGALSKADTESLANQIMLGLGARGTAATVDPKLAAMARTKGGLDNAKLRAQAEADALLKEEGARELETGEFIGGAARPSNVRANTSKEMAALEAAEKQARKQKRSDVRAAFADEPDLARHYEGQAELADARRAQASSLPPTGERTRPAHRTAVDEAPRTLEEVPGGLAVTEPDALTSGLAKVNRGRAFDLTAQEKVAINASKSQWNRPKVEGGKVDQELLTAMAVGATGLGLAMAMQPDEEEAALAIGAGALVLGRGRGLTLEEIGKAGDATPLGVLLDRSETTLSTLEKLPRNRFEFTKQQIEDLAKRQEVTKAERDVIAEILKHTPEGSKTVTAKDLMAGFKIATGNFELKKAERSDYANYGLERISRSVADDVNFTAEDIAGADIVPHRVRGQWEVRDPNGGAVLEYITLPETATMADAQVALTQWQARAKAALDGSNEPTTRVWQSPLELGDNNHFGDPNYFGHTRSFEEGGVRHVVEVQSDLAQKVGKTLTPEETTKAQEALAANEEQIQLYRQLEYALSRAGDYLSPEQALAEYKELEPRILAANPDATMQLEIKLLKNLPDAAKDAWGAKWEDTLEGKSLQELEDSGYGHFLRSPVDAPQARRQLLQAYLDGRIDISEGVLDWALKNPAVLRFPGEPARGQGGTLADTLHRYFSFLAENARVRAAEFRAKLATSDSSGVGPMLKNWDKRLIREEIADAARKREETSNLVETRRREIREYQAEIERLTTPSEWTRENKARVEGYAYDLDVLEMDIRNGKVGEAAARDQMLRMEASLPPEVQSRWKQYYENSADETGEFLRPSEAGGTWGVPYAANFPRVMSEFLKQELGKSPYADMYKAMIGDAQADITRLEKMPKVIRFATADTVKKVEGWPERGLYTSKDVVEYDGYSSNRRIGNIDDVYGKKHFGEFEYTGKFRSAFDGSGFEAELRGAKDPNEVFWARERLSNAGPELKQKLGYKKRLAPEHQGIYDRYKKDIEKFLKQLGGKEVVDSSGHSWLEVPLEGSKDKPAGARVQQFGRADPEMLGKVAIIGGGAALAAFLSSEENKGKNAAIAATVAGLGLYARSRVPAVADWVSAVGRGAEYGLGVVSTRVKDMSPALLRRMRDHELGVLKQTNEALNVVAPFVERLRKVSGDVKTELNSAILSNDNARVLKVLAASGDPGLVVEWRKVRGLLERTGESLKGSGRLKGLLPDYYPRVVVDAEGLLKALGKSERTILEAKIAKARSKAARLDGRDISPLELSQIINKHLKSQSGTGRPGFLKKRSVDEVSPELAKFYAPASESLPLYLRAAMKEIERAKFFGEDLVRDPEGGMVNLDLSIGNVVNKEVASGKITWKQAEELRSILQSRFGPGERGMSAPLQTMKNLSNAGLLGHVTSAMVQLGDVGTAFAAYGLVPTVKALQQVVTRKPARATVRDIGIVDRISEEIAGAAKKPVIIAGREISSAKFLDLTFKLSGFSLVDQLGKSTAINAALNRNRSLAQTPKGVEKLRSKYGEAYGKDFDQLVADLRGAEMTDLTRSMLFSELSDLQPISKLEVPQMYLDMPNGRVIYMLKTFMIKQADIVRREAIQEMRKGNTLKGTENLLRYGLALGIAGATTDFVRNWILGRDDKLEWGDVPENMLRTFGWSQYTIDKARRGEPIAAASSAAIPPYRMWEEIMRQDPKAAQYLPVVGRLVYAHGLDGAEKANEKAAKKREREAEARYTK